MALGLTKEELKAVLNEVWATMADEIEQAQKRDPEHASDNGLVAALQSSYRAVAVAIEANNRRLAEQLWAAGVNLPE